MSIKLQDSLHKTNLTKKTCHIQKITSNCSQREQGKIKHISIAKQESKTQNDKNEKQ